MQDSITACCLLPKNHDLAKIRNDLLNGIASADCQQCWKIEAQQQDSRRIQENRFLDYKLNRNIDLIEDDCKKDKNEILLYQIFLSNLCNQACVTCGSGASTKWGELEQQTKKSIRIVKTDLANQDIDYARAKRIFILGGEPLFDPAVVKLLESLLEHHNQNCFLSFVTNGSVRLSARMKLLLSQFSDLNICISVDGIGSRFEYMRWPGKWNTLLANLDEYQVVTKNNISISYTISAVNALYYKETTEWFTSKQLRYNHNIVRDLAWASLERMPVVIKDRLEHPFFTPWKSINGSEISADQFRQHLSKQDHLKKISMQDYMPELYDILSSNA